ncbi:MAG: hypothetical protein RR887_13700, partial [Niameybacter sp.]
TQEITNHSDRIILPSGSIDKDKVGRAYKLVLYNNLPMTSSTTLDIYNQTNEVLEVEIRTGLAEAMGLKVQVKRGMVNKSYPAARAKKDRYSLYHLEVHVAEEKTGQELARIQTTKLD